MRSYRVRHLHHFEDEPEIIWFQVDDSQNEIRKVER